MVAQLAIALALAYGALASFFDLRERRIPNALTYAFFLAAVFLAIAGGLFSLAYAASVAVSFAFAYALYKFGVWAGGDAKFFVGVSAFYALARQPSLFSFATLFLNSAFVLVPVVLLLQRGRLLLRRVKKISELKPGDIPAQTVFVQSRKTIFWNPLSLFRLATALRSLDFRVLYAHRPRGKIIADSQRARGLSTEEINKLRKLGVKQLEVRESIAFAPAMAIGFVLSLYLVWW